MESFLFISWSERLEREGLLLVRHQRNCSADLFTSAEKQQLHEFAIGEGSAMRDLIFTRRIDGWTVFRQVGDHDISRTSGFDFYERALVTICAADSTARFFC